jgi:hypothetical protein
VNPLFFLLSFVDVVAILNRIAIIVGGIAGGVFYQIYPENALLISGLGFGSLVYLVDYFRRKRIQ